MFLAIELINNNNWICELVILVCKTVKSNVGEVLTCKLELGTVHLNKLVYAIKEEDEVWSKILAIVDVGPSRHLKL